MIVDQSQGDNNAIENNTNNSNEFFSDYKTSTGSMNGSQYFVHNIVSRFKD